MNCIVRYLSHPQVSVDPRIPVGHWSLSDVGRDRTKTVTESRRLKNTTRIVSGAETKAIETATIIAATLVLDISVREDMHENDQSSTGFLPQDKFDAMAEAFFANPDRSVKGWERAIDAQSRIVAATSEVVSHHRDGDLLLVGHGAVGTLLYCHFAGQPIDRIYDQPVGGGNYFAIDLETTRVLHHWQPMENLVQENTL